MTGGRWSEAPAELFTDDLSRRDGYVKWKKESLAY
jgi:hypothetical protein